MSDESDFLWIWVPCESYGPIRFGDDLAKTAAMLGMILTERSSSIGDIYMFPNSAEISVGGEDNKIESTCTTAEVLFEGRDILQLTLDEVEARFGPPDECGEYVADVGTPYEFENVGLQLWVDVRGYACSAVLSDCDYDEE